jgi:hypothetical protein
MIRITEKENNLRISLQKDLYLAQGEITAEKLLGLGMRKILLILCRSMFLHHQLLPLHQLLGLSVTNKSQQLIQQR